jgi:type IV pilus assembly protein PilB
MPTFHDEKSMQKLALLRLQEEEELARVLSKKYGFAYVDLTQEAISTDAMRLLAEPVAREAEVAAFKRIDKKLGLAMRTPNNPKIPEIMRDLTERGYTVMVYLVSRHSLERAWDLYKDLSFAVETQAGLLDISGDQIIAVMRAVHTFDDAKKSVMEVLAMKKVYRITRTVETLIAGAMATGASDIHIEPEEAEVRIRFRLDGVLTPLLSLDLETYNLILNRLKLLSGLKLNVKTSAQDGRFSVRIDTKDIEIRTSILPGNYGESVVMRLLDPHTISVNLEELGLSAQLLTILTHEISKPNGMILTTGPTGSGKTTMLYALLKKIHTPDIKILTIEDPVEYHLPGIVQTQVNHKDYTFATGLRSALRQDPDVIMVGEIRDHEVADTAIQASLTGHLVLSTLHTNNAAGAYPRLLDLGVEPSVIGSSVNIVMAQRLVRRVVQEKCTPVTLSGEWKEMVDLVLKTLPPGIPVPQNTTTTWEPPEENGGIAGYKGRVGVYEAVHMTPEIDAVVKRRGGARELTEAARPQGIMTMHQDAIVKALNGMTSMSEIVRILGGIEMLSEVA